MSFAALPDEILDLIVTAFIGFIHADLHVPEEVPPHGHPDEWDSLTRRPPFGPPPADILTAPHWRALAPLAATCRASRSAVARSITGLSLGLRMPPAVRRLAASPNVEGDAPPRPLAATVAAVTAELAATTALLRRLPRLTHLTAPLHVDAPASWGPRGIAAGVWDMTAEDDRQGWLFYVWSVGLLNVLRSLRLRSLQLHWQGESFLAEHLSYIESVVAEPMKRVSWGPGVVAPGERAPPSANGAAPPAAAAATDTAAATAPSAAATPPRSFTGRLSGAPLRSLVLTLRSTYPASGYTPSAWARSVGAAVAAHVDTLEALVLDSLDDPRFPALGALLDVVPRAPRLVAFATSGALGGITTHTLARVAPGLRALTIGRRGVFTPNALRLLARTRVTGGDGDDSRGVTRPLHFPDLEFLDMSSALAGLSSEAYFPVLSGLFTARTFDTLLLSPGLYGPAVGNLLMTALLSLRTFPHSLSIPNPLSDAHVKQLLAASAGRLRRLHLGDTEALSANGLRALGAAASRSLVHLDVGSVDGDALLEAAPVLGTVPTLVLHVGDWSSACLSDVLAAIGSGGATTTVTLRSSVVWAEDFEGVLDWWPKCLRSLVLAGCRGIGSAEAAEVASSLSVRRPRATLTWRASFPV